MWTDTTRAQDARKGPGLPSDLRDAERGGTGATVAAGVGVRSATEMADASDSRWDTVSAARRPSVADAAFKLSADEHGAALFLRVARQRIVQDNQPLSAD